MNLIILRPEKGKQIDSVCVEGGQESPSRNGILNMPAHIGWGVNGMLDISETSLSIVKSH